jgi:glycosyltransferase involved in cell wall biosynthesis
MKIGSAESGASNRKMDICYDYQVFAAQKYGGISRYFVEIASRIGQFPGAKVRVIAPLFRCKLLQEKRDSIPVVGRYFSSDFARATGLCLRTDAAFSKPLSAFSRFDIIHETYYSAKSTIRSGKKTVITVYDTIAELYPDPPSEKPKIFPARKAAFDRADHLICISNNTREDLIRLYEVEPAKVSVIHLASSVSPSGEPPLSTAEPFFLFIGGRWGYKNFLGLAQAYRESNLYQSHKIVCFGGGPFARHEVERLEELGLPLNRFEIIGGDDSVLSRYYASAVALVYPSFYEGFGIPLLEAMECSCPVLSGRSSSLPEVAADAAGYFDAADPSSIASAMLKVANSTDERRQLIARGRERVKQFSWDKCAQETYAVYERVLSNS